jgi:hypothetical protein
MSVASGRISMTSLRALLFVLATLPLSAAHAEPWLCTDADGYRSFSYDPASARDRNCVHHPIPSPNTFRVSPPQPPARAQKPRAARAPGAGVSAFPRVDARTQKQRDAQRRQILERELENEKQALNTAIQELAERKRLLFGRESDQGRAEVVLKPYADRIRVHLINIESLEKELRGDG